jgi:proteic killer suppression protein
MIKSYRDKRTEAFANGERVSRFELFKRKIEKRLRILDATESLVDLGQLRSNRLESLRADRKGQYSIRINDQLRICCVWLAGSEGPEDVEIVDYH